MVPAKVIDIKYKGYFCEEVSFIFNMCRPKRS